MLSMTSIFGACIVLLSMTGSSGSSIHLLNTIEDNCSKLAKTPPMGWMSWQTFRCQVDCSDEETLPCINENLYKTQGDLLSKLGFVDAGYATISVDDCWSEMSRDADGRLVANATRFPKGMKALGDYLHEKNIKFGLYVDEGEKTCAGYPGSKGFEHQDAQALRDWGVDYIKVDGCYNKLKDYEEGYRTMGKSLREGKRDIVYSCSWPAYISSPDEKVKPFAKMIEAGCNLWRNYDDIQCSWDSLSTIVNYFGDNSKYLKQFAGPGHWHDPDMLLVGTNCISLGESRIQLAIWSILAAPLIMSNDLRHISEEARDLLLNKDMIAVNQDSLGQAGYRHSPSGDLEVWVRHLSGNFLALALINKSEKDGSLVVDLDALNWKDRFGSLPYMMFNIFAKTHKTGFKRQFSMSIDAHDVVFLKLFYS